MADTPARDRVSGPQLTIREAATWLDPPITTEQLAALIRVASVPPGGQRRNGRRGRPELTYDAATLMELHAAICRWLLPACHLHSRRVDEIISREDVCPPAGDCRRSSPPVGIVMSGGGPCSA